MGCLTVTLGRRQHVSGLGVTMLCTGLAFYFYRLIFGQPSQPPQRQAVRDPGRPGPGQTFPGSGRCCSTSSRSVYLAFAARAARRLRALPHALGPRPAHRRREPARRGRRRRQRRLGALPGADDLGRADGHRPAPICRSPSSTPSPSASSPAAAGSASRWSSSASGSPGAARVRRCCSPPSMRCSSACRRAARSTCPIRSS